MKKLVLIMIMLMFSLGGCGNNLANENIDKGKIELENKQYDKALALFRAAISEGSDDQEVRELIRTIISFEKGKKLFEEGSFEEAQKVLDSIDKSYVNYSIKDDIDGLKEDIIAYKENDKFINSELVSIEQLINEGNYIDAKTKSEDLLVSGKPISEVHQKKIDEHIIAIDKEIVRIETEKSEQERIKKEKLEKEKLEAVKVSNSEKMFCVGNHYVDKKDFLEVEGRCKGCSIGRTLTSFSSNVDCPICGSTDSISRLDGICSSCNTKAIPAIVGVENDGTIIYDDGTKGKEDHNFF